MALFSVDGRLEGCQALRSPVTGNLDALPFALKGI